MMVSRTRARAGSARLGGGPFGVPGAPEKSGRSDCGAERPERRRCPVVAVLGASARGPLWSAPSSPLASPWWWARAMPRCGSTSCGCEKPLVANPAGAPATRASRRRDHGRRPGPRCGSTSRVCEKTISLLDRREERIDVGMENNRRFSPHEQMFAYPAPGSS
jgi:hypothetical protein